MSCGIVQGQSMATIKKEAAIQTCMNWVLAVNKPSEFFVFDLNCGCGENRQNGASCRGTGPLIRNNLRKRGIFGHMWLCDLSVRSLSTTRRRFFNPTANLYDQEERIDGIEAEFIHMDNREFVPMIPLLIRKRGKEPAFVHGLIVADPNGLKVPVLEISQVLRECSMIDLAIHISGLKQVASYKRKHPDAPRANFGPTVITSISSVIDLIPKRTWLVSVPFRAKAGRDHIVMYGTNLRYVKPIKDMAGRPDMYRHDSVEGMALIRELDRFKPEAA